MFTGIVESIGNIKHIKQTGDTFTMAIEADDILTDADIGDSISVNGVCLTITSLSPGYFTVDIMRETVKATNLQSLVEGSSVNLERSMPANGRFGGHFVSGHVDGTGKIVKKERQGNAVYYDIQTSAGITRYLIQKGSVAVDGTSLTVFAVTDRAFTISLIPHTLDATVLGQKQAGDIVNIECDLVGKYIEKLLAER
ncbi:MAG TPA: riboflavin synthase [Bacillales bacterium]|nr:riboflavin synthase [Bacillales bacterium]